MAVSDQALVLSLLYGLMGYTAITLFLIIKVKRDFWIGIKKWWYRARGKKPMSIYYAGADQNITEYIIPSAGLNEVLTIKSEKKSFFMDKQCMKRRDDGVNFLAFSYKSTMPINPEMTKTDIEAALVKDGEISRSKFEKLEEGKAYVPVDIEGMAQYTDPARLNKFTDYVYLDAKLDALKDAQDLIKWVKWTFFVAAIGVIVGAAIYQLVKGDVLPAIAAVKHTAAVVNTTAPVTIPV